MDTKALRMFVSEHRDGIEIRMIGDSVHRVPHRDYIWITPAFGESESCVGRLAASFWLHDAERDETRLVNALLVSEVIPLRRNGNGRGKGGKSKRKH